MAGFLDFLTSWVLIVIPQPCFDEYFIKYNFFEVECLKTVISKCLGLGIILGSVLVKVPQIIKLMNAKSAEGISLTGVSLELLAVTSSFAYGFAKEYPFSSYGDNLFLLIQTWAIAFLLQQYTGKASQALTYTGGFGLVLAFLLSPVAPMGLLQFLYSCVIPNIVLGRSIQILSNYRNASTGQLSGITCFLLFAGSLARIFTSFQETGDFLMILTYVIASTCNGIIFFQLLYYRDSDKKTKIN